MTRSPSEIRPGSSPAGYAQAPPLAVYTEKRLQVAVTARNWNTVTKLASLASTLAGDYSS